MKLLDTIKSQTGKVTKYVFQLSDGLISEVALIYKGDGKNSICVSCQTLCAQQCAFCYTTDFVGKLKLRNLHDFEMLQMINIVYNHINKPEDMLLVSFMGCGEPLCNVEAICTVMSACLRNYLYKTVRFAVATSIPKANWGEFFTLCNYVSYRKLDMKLHLSLHHTYDIGRKKMMPKALNIEASVQSLKWAVSEKGLKAEIHYALVKGVNDFKTNMIALSNMFGGTGINVKFIRLNEKPSSDLKGLDYNEVKHPIPFLEDVEYEFYSPPGIDIGASCGQFLMDYYERYNGIN